MDWSFILYVALENTKRPLSRDRGSSFWLWLLLSRATHKVTISIKTIGRRSRPIVSFFSVCSAPVGPARSGCRLRLFRPGRCARLLLFRPVPVVGSGCSGPVGVLGSCCSGPFRLSAPVVPARSGCRLRLVRPVPVVGSGWLLTLLCALTSLLFCCFPSCTGIRPAFVFALPLRWGQSKNCRLLATYPFKGPTVAFKKVVANMSRDRPERTHCNHAMCSQRALAHSVITVCILWGGRRCRGSLRGIISIYVLPLGHWHIWRYYDRRNGGALPPV